MALNDVTFVKGQGGLGRPLAGEDHISGFVFYLPDSSLPKIPDPSNSSNQILIPGGFSTTDRIKTFYSIIDAEKCGLTKDSTDRNLMAFWYHISEYFRIQPKGVLYVGIFAPPAGTPPAFNTHNYDELRLLQNAANGTIRQAAVYITGAFDSTNKDMITALHNKAKAISDDHKPLSVLFAGDISGVSDLTSLPDLRTFVSPYVSVVIGQDGASLGSTLYDTTNYPHSISCIGAALGAVSRASVSENIGWVKNFDLSGSELDVAAFGNKQLYRDQAPSLLNTLNTNHYIFLRKHVGLNGTYFNDSFTADADTSDYCTIENNRTVDKSIRNIRTLLVPELNGPLYVDSDGKLSEDTIAYFKSLSSRPLEQMQRDGELSAFQIIIDPTQNVLSSSSLNITVKLVPVGVARNIVVNIGFTVKIS